MNLEDLMYRRDRNLQDAIVYLFATVTHLWREI